MGQGDAPDERMVRSTPGLRCQVSGVRDGRRKTGDVASHGRGIVHDRMGTHGVPWPVPISGDVWHFR